MGDLHDLTLLRSVQVLGQMLLQFADPDLSHVDTIARRCGYIDICIVQGRGLEDALNGSGRIGLTSPAIFGYVRVATSGRVLTSAMPVTDATDRVRSWLAQPNARFIVPGPGHLEIAFRLLEAIGTGSNLTTDVQLAAYAIEQDAELCSNDTDFARFPDLRWKDPL